VNDALGAATQAHQKTDYRADEKNDEQYFRDAGCADRDSAKTKHGGNQSDDEKDYGIVKHDRTFGFRMAFTRLPQVSWNALVGAVGTRRRDV
jgi:hypothetical protein